jgi:hypothetical protein
MRRTRGMVVVILSTFCSSWFVDLVTVHCYRRTETGYCTRFIIPRQCSNRFRHILGTRSMRRHLKDGHPRAVKHPTNALLFHVGSLIAWARMAAHFAQGSSVKSHATGAMS